MREVKGNPTMTSDMTCDLGVMVKLTSKGQKRSTILLLPKDALGDGDSEYTLGVDLRPRGHGQIDLQRSNLGLIWNIEEGSGFIGFKSSRVWGFLIFASGLTFDPEGVKGRGQLGQVI